MDTETHEIPEGTISGKSRPPLDVRIVAYYLCASGFLDLAISFFFGTGIARPVESQRVLLGTVVVASGLAYSIHCLTTGICNLFCAWGLMRRGKFAWWFSLIFVVCCLIDTVLVLPEHQIAVAISMTISIGLIAWLWFRRELYGVHLAAGRPKK